MGLPWWQPHLRVQLRPQGSQGWSNPRSCSCKVQRDQLAGLGFTYSRSDKQSQLAVVCSLTVHRSLLCWFCNTSQPEIWLKTSQQHTTTEATQPSGYCMTWKEQAMQNNFISYITYHIYRKCTFLSMYGPAGKALLSLTAHLQPLTVYCKLISCTSLQSCP